MLRVGIVELEGDAVAIGGRLVVAPLGVRAVDRGPVLEERAPVRVRVAAPVGRGHPVVAPFHEPVARADPHLVRRAEACGEELVLDLVVDGAVDDDDEVAAKRLAVRPRIVPAEWLGIHLVVHDGIRRRVDIMDERSPRGGRCVGGRLPLRRVRGCCCREGPPVRGLEAGRAGPETRSGKDVAVGNDGCIIWVGRRGAGASARAVCPLARRALRTHGRACGWRWRDGGPGAGAEGPGDGGRRRRRRRRRPGRRRRQRRRRQERRRRWRLEHPEATDRMVETSAVRRAR